MLRTPQDPYQGGNQNPDLSQPNSNIFSQDLSYLRNQNLVENSNSNYQQKSQPGKQFQSQPNTNLQQNFNTQSLKPNQQTQFNQNPSSKPKPKKNFGLKRSLIVLIVLIIFVVAAGIYFYYDYTQRQSQSEAVTTYLVTNFDEYTKLTNGVVSTVSTDRPELQLSGLNFESFNDQMQEEIDSIEIEVQNHESFLSSFDEPPNANIQSFRDQIINETNESSLRLMQIGEGHQSILCINTNLLLIFNLSQDIDSLTQVSDIDQNNQMRLEENLSNIDSLSGYINQFSSAIGELQTCLDQNGGIYSQEEVDITKSELTEVQNIYIDLGESLTELRANLEARNNQAVEESQIDIETISNQADEIELSVDFYQLFEQQMTSKIDEYETFVNDSQKVLQSEHEKLLQEFGSDNLPILPF